MPRPLTIAGDTYEIPTEGKNSRRTTEWMSAVNETLTTGDYIDAGLAYGVSASNTAAENTTAINAAIAAAIAANKALILPPGTLKHTLSSSAGTFPISGDLTIIGAGQGVTILKADVATLSTEAYTFKIAADKTLRLIDLTGTGPDALYGVETFASVNWTASNLSGLDSPANAFVLHGGTTVDGTEPEIYMENVSSTNYAHVAGIARAELTAAPGTYGLGKITAKNCHFRARKTPISAYSDANIGGNANTNNGFIDLDTCNIGMQSDGFNGGTSCKFNAIKMERIVGFRIRNCTIEDAVKYQIFQDAGATSAPKCKMALIENCRINRLTNGGGQAGIYCSPSSGPLVVNDCMFFVEDGYGISKGEGLLLSDSCTCICYGGDSGFIHNDDGPDGPAIVTNFYIGKGDSDGYLNAIRRQNLEIRPVLPSHGLDLGWIFRNGYIDDSPSPSNGFLFDAGYNVFENVTFNCPNAANAGIIKAGTFIARNCRIMSGSRGIYVSSPEGPVRSEWWDNDFASNINFDAGSGNPIWVVGGDNYFHSGLSFEGGGANCEGRMSLRHGEILKPPANWATSTAYTAGNEVLAPAADTTLWSATVSARTMVYRCKTNGTSAGSGNGPAAWGSSVTAASDIRGTANDPEAITDGTTSWRWIENAKDRYVWVVGTTTLTLPWNGDTVLFNEAATPTINTIHLKSPTAGAAVEELTNAIIKIYAVADLVLGNSGNITAAAGTRSAGAIITLQYFPSLTKWVEI